MKIFAGPLVAIRHVPGAAHVLEGRVLELLEVAELVDAALHAPTDNEGDQQHEYGMPYLNPCDGSHQPVKLSRRLRPASHAAKREIMREVIKDPAGNDAVIGDADKRNDDAEPPDDAPGRARPVTTDQFGY